MNKIIRGRNNNTRKVKVLFISQVVLGIMPVLLLIFFVWKKLYSTPIVAAVFIILIFLCNVAYAFLARQYAVLNSGVRVSGGCSVRSRSSTARTSCSITSR